MTVTLTTPTHLYIAVALKGLVSQAPYLIHEAAITPHIAGRGELLVVQGLEWNRDRMEGNRESEMELVLYHVMTERIEAGNHGSRLGPAHN